LLYCFSHELAGDVQLRGRDIVSQIYDSDNVRILKEVVSNDYVYLHAYSSSIIEYEYVGEEIERSHLYWNKEFRSFSNPCTKSTWWFGFYPEFEVNHFFELRILKSVLWAHEF
jgi:hypothetical protein